MTTFDFRVKFTIGTGIVLTVAGVAVVFTYIKYDNLRKVLEFSTTVAATVAGLTGASYAAQSLTRDTEETVQNLIRSAEETKINRTLSFISRWNDSSFDKKLAVQLIRNLRDKPPSNVKTFVISEIDQNNDLKSEVTNILNFFEEMALSINDNFVDEDILRSFLRGIVFTYVETFSYWIDHRRDLVKNEKIFQSVTELCEQWKNGHGKAKNSTLVLP